MPDQKLKTFAGLSAAAAISMLGVGIVSSRLPCRVIDLAGGDGALVGLLASSFALPYIFLQVPVGNLSDRYGFKPFLLLGYFLSAVSGIFFYFAGSSLPIFIGRAIQGAGEIPVWALAPALISIVYPDHKGKMIGFYTAAAYIMLSIGPLLVPCFPGLFGETGGFLLFSFLCATSFTIILFTLKNQGQTNIKNGKKSFEIHKIFSLFADIRVRIVLTGIFLYGCGQGLLFSIAPGWLVTARNYGSMDIGILFSAYYVCISAAQFLYGPFSDKYGRVIFMVFGLICTALAWALFPYVSKTASTVLLGITAGSMGGFFVASMAFLQETAPDHLKGTISGAYYLFWGMGYFLGPMIWSVGGIMMGMEKSFLVFSILLVLTATAIGSYKKKAVQKI